MESESFWGTIPGALTAVGGIITALATLVGALYSAGLVGKRRAAEDSAKRTDSVTTVVPPPPPRPAVLELRPLPAILSGKELGVRLVQHGLFDRRANPAGRGIAHDYESRVVGSDVTVTDHATGLMWQHDGSDGPRVFADAEEYVRGLNRDRFGGSGDWRLPTGEEVASLMDPRDDEGVHLSPVFQPGANFVWTSDRHADGCIWVAYFFDGHLACESPSFNAWVRAVRTAEPRVHGGIR